MPAISAQAPGKVILFGEHAVVYGRPALAVPLTHLQARAVVTPHIAGRPGEIRLIAPDIGLQTSLADLPENHPLALAVRRTCQALGPSLPPPFDLTVTSSIPVASGLGSGAAVSVAVVRAVSSFLGSPLPDETVSGITFEIEKIHHGTPSGIDNTVVTYARPVFFIRGQPPEPLHVRQPFTLVVGDTGIRSPTARAVAGVRFRWEREPAVYEQTFDRIAQVVLSARRAIETGATGALGPLMDKNQALLETIGVSSPELERLIQAARRAGAQGAKLSGAGAGGNMIALVEAGQAESVTQALQASGAVRVVLSEIPAG